VYYAKSQRVQVVYISLEEHKPDLPDEHIFAISANHGMMEFAMPETTAQTVALSQYGKEGPHFLTALEQLICLAAQGWEQSKQGRYRDDIAVGVSQIWIPPAPPAHKIVMLEEVAFQNAKFVA
jgi:hypothetical protein